MKTPIYILLAVLLVLMIVLALASTLGSDWTTIGQEVAPVIILIGFVGFVLALALGRK